MATRQASASTTKFLCSAVLMIAFCLSLLHAQTKAQWEIYLRNGEMVRGVVHPVTSQDVLKVENSCGIRLISKADIDTVLVFKVKKNHLSKEKGFYSLSSLTLLFGKGEAAFAPLPSLTTAFGYRLDNNLMVGLGTGFDQYKWSVLPFFAEGRYLVGGEEVVFPWISIRLGYAFPLQTKYPNDGYYNSLEDNTHGGILLNPEAGIWFPLTIKSGLSLSMGYHHQRLSYDLPLFDWRFGQLIGERRIFKHYNRINVRMGLYFN